MNLTKKGFITQIDEVKELGNGAKTLRYRINTEEEYNNIWEFEIYKGAEYAEHVENFVKYNKVGDRVEVEFNIRPREWQDKIFTSLSHWKITKLTEEENAIQGERTAAEMGMAQDEMDDLPF